MNPPPSEPHRPQGPDRTGQPEPPRSPGQTLPPAGPAVTDLPPIRRLLRFLYLMAGLCILLAVAVWWRMLR